MIGITSTTMTTAAQDMTTVTTIVVTATVGIALLAIPWVWKYYCNNHNQKKTKQHNNIQDVPWAPGAIPVLGHALLYKKDPAGFLVQTCQQRSNKIFRLNLAGKDMILVCGPSEQRQIATLPESIMSARQAVADIGFEYTLGPTNVHKGTDIHKGIVKGIFHCNKSGNNVGDKVRDDQVQTWLRSIQNSFQKEITAAAANSTSSTTKVDFFHLIRRVTLRTTVDVMIGQSFLQDDGWNDNFDFMTEFMNFQDTLEDVTAKSVVLPRPIALVTMLWPLQRRRLQLQQTIASRLTKIMHNNKNDDNDNDNWKGFWLRAMEDDNHDVDTIAELIIGLLFAAHKNPAIGAAQTFLLLHEHATSQQLEDCRLEAKALLTNPTWKQLTSSSSMSSNSTKSNSVLRRACMESLRLTSHSIGGVRTAQQDVIVTSSGDDTTGQKIQYRIPKGSSVGLVHIASSLDPSIWGSDATKFDLTTGEDDDNDSENRQQLYQDEYKFTTFSHGVHVCPGQQLAIMMVQLINAVLLNNDEYTVTLPNEVPPLCFERATLAQRAKPVMVSISVKK